MRSLLVQLSASVAPRRALEQRHAYRRSFPYPPPPLCFPAPVRGVKAQYFLSFAVMGTTMPFIARYLQSRGLDPTQIGYVISTAGVAAIAMPPVMALLADTRFDNRRLIAVSFLLSALTLVGIWSSHAFAALLLMWAAHSFVYTPQLPLQDGMFFGLQRLRRDEGKPERAYHRTRVWGTIGFLVPGLLLYVPLSKGRPVADALLWGAALGILGILNSFRLRPTRRSRISAASAPEAAAATKAIASTKAKLPTLDALRLLMRPPLRVFAFAMFLLTMAGMCYYAFYPVYLVQQVGIDDRWLGPISSFGVALEALFVLGYGWIVRKIGLRNLMLLSIATAALRYALLAAFPTPLVAVGTQVIHGITVLGLGMVPPVFLDRHATNENRNSMQGVYVMLVSGLGRIAGSLAAGPVANRSLTAVFAFATILTCIAMVLVAVAFYEESHAPAHPEVARASCP
jgi:PPP family 3-phenylpropionic acid transporter